MTRWKLVSRYFPLENRFQPQAWEIYELEKRVQVVQLQSVHKIYHGNFIVSHHLCQRQLSLISDDVFHKPNSFVSFGWTNSLTFPTLWFVTRTDGSSLRKIDDQCQNGLCNKKTVGKFSQLLDRGVPRDFKFWVKTAAFTWHAKKTSTVEIIELILISGVCILNYIKDQPVKWFVSTWKQVQWCSLFAFCILELMRW